MSGFLNIAGNGFGSEPAEDALIVGPSQLNNWWLCNYRELYRNEPWYDNSSSLQAAFGTGEHALIERFLTTGDRPAFSGEAMEIWIQAMLHHPKHPEDITKYADNVTLLTVAAEMLGAFELWLTSYWQEEGQHQPPLLTETTLRRPLGRLPNGREVWVEGTADRVTALGETAAMGIDWKTGGKGWKRGKAESNVQHTVYGWLVEPMIQPHRVVQATYVVYDRQHQVWTWNDKRIMLTKDMTYAALRSMWDMARGLDAEIGTASPTTRGGFGDGRGWHCKAPWCPAWNGCPFKFVIQDKYSEEERPTQMRWSL